MNLYYTEDEQADFLLARGYMICVQGEISEVNIYQNVFVEEPQVIIRAIKNNEVESLESAFEREFKQALIRV